MSYKVIVVNGVAQHGKDSFVKYCQEFFNGISINHSTVETVKKAGKIFGADETRVKTDKDRRLWSDLKDAWTRYNDGPFQEIISRVEEAVRVFTPQYDLVFFIHAREPDEIQKIKNHYGHHFTAVLVINPNTDHVPDNHADQGVFDYNYDVVVENGGTIDDLKDCAKTFIDDLCF